MHILVIIQLLEDWPPIFRFFLLLVTVKYTQRENSQRMYTQHLNGDNMWVIWLRIILLFKISLLIYLNMLLL